VSSEEITCSLFIRLFCAVCSSRLFATCLTASAFALNHEHIASELGTALCMYEQGGPKSEATFLIVHVTKTPKAI